MLLLCGRVFFRLFLAPTLRDVHRHPNDASGYTFLLDDLVANRNPFLRAIWPQQLSLDTDRYVTSRHCFRARSFKSFVLAGGVSARELCVGRGDLLGESIKPIEGGRVTDHAGGDIQLP